MSFNIEDCTKIIMKDKNTGEIVQEVDFNLEFDRMQKDGKSTKDREE